MSGRGPMALVAVSFALLMAAWVMASQPFTGPDEISHYLRALSISNGTLVGPRVPYAAPAALTPAEVAWTKQDVRGVQVPARLAPPGINCIDGKPDVSTCVEATTVGDYHPLAYFLPALTLSASHDAQTGAWLAHAASAVPCAVFIVLALVLLWGGTGWSLLGLLLAITPMVLFVGSAINPNGLEVAASLAFAAAVLRIARDPAHTPSSVWFAFAVSGAIAILAWQLGPVYVIADVALGAALLGRPGLRRLGSAAGRPVGLSALVLVTATSLYLAYGFASGLFHSTFGIRPIRASLHQGVNELVSVLRHSVGVFGPLTVHLPSGSYWVWWLLVLGLLAVALWLVVARERLLLMAVTALAFAFPVLFYAWVYRFSGFGLQGRYVLPVLTLVPLLAGELSHRRIAARSDGRYFGWVMAAGVWIIAAFQLYAWWVNARNSAGKPHAFWFLAHPGWSPPLGWWPWTTAAILGAIGLLGFGALQVLAGRRQRTAGTG